MIRHDSKTQIDNIFPSKSFTHQKKCYFCKTTQRPNSIFRFMNCKHSANHIVRGPCHRCISWRPEMRSATISIIIFTITAGISSCINDDDSNESIITVGSKLPHFEVSLNDGRIFDSSQYDDLPLVVSFFNTTCEDCRAELPIIQEVYAELGESAEFIAISREENRQAVEKYWESEGLTMPFSAQSDRQIYNMFALSGIPRIYIADKSRTVAAAYGPEDAPTAERLKITIQTLIK